MRIVRSNRSARSFILYILAAIELDQMPTFSYDDIDDIGLLAYDIYVKKFKVSRKIRIAYHFSL